MELMLKVQPTRYPPEPAQPFRAWCWRLVKKKYFEPVRFKSKR
jgi:hypothetical protein